MDQIFRTRKKAAFHWKEKRLFGIYTGSSPRYINNVNMTNRIQNHFSGFWLFFYDFPIKSGFYTLF